MTDKKIAEEYFKKSALTIKIFKYIVISLFIIFLISCIVIFRRDITVQNIQLLAKYISLNSSSSVYSDEFSVSCSDDSTAIMLRDNLGIIDNKNIGLYDLSGQKLFSFNFAYSAPAVVYDKHSIIVYDVKGTELSLFNSFSKLKTMSFDGGISCADVKDDVFAVIYNNDSYRSILSVYEYSSKDNDYLETFKFSSSSAFLTSLSISDNSRYLLVSSTTSDSGNYLSSVMIYDTLSDSTQPLHSVQIPAELPVKVGFSNRNNSVYVITDSGIMFLNFNLEQTSYYKFNQSKIDNFYIGSDSIIITERNNLSGNTMLLTAISKSGEAIFKENVQDEIIDVCFGSDCIFALGKKSVHSFDIETDNSVFVKSTYLNEKYYHIVSSTDDICYILNDNSAKRVSFDKEDE